MHDLTPAVMLTDGKCAGKDPVVANCLRVGGRLGKTSGQTTLQNKVQLNSTGVFVDADLLSKLHLIHYVSFEKEISNQSKLYLHKLRNTCRLTVTPPAKS